MALRIHQQCFPLAAMLLLFTITCQAHFTTNKPVKPEQYLAQFGYLNPNTFGINEAGDSSPGFTDALKTFQKKFKLTVTGEFDEATKRQMEQPRCGYPDIGKYRPDTYNSSHGRVLYDDYGYRWKKLHLTYAFYKNRLGPYPIPVLRNIVRRITSSWSNASNFTFSEVGIKKNPDFTIAFFTRGDPLHLKECPGSDFDGPGHVLAHGYLAWQNPPGRIISALHVDGSESFATTTMPTDDQFDLESIMLHEMGHVLGLSHTDWDENSVMFPKAFLGKRRTKLTHTDVHEMWVQYAT